METIRVIARGSKLSRLQVDEALGQFPELHYEVRYLQSFGDVRQDISLLNGEAPADIFTRELDGAIRSGQADIAVHSAKDLPYPLPKGLEVVALFPAFDTTDSLVSRDSSRLSELKSGSVVGTSSPLRKKGLEELRPDLVVKGIRGCIEERIAQVKEGKYDAAIVATCALKRLGLESEIAEVLPFSTHPLQGYLAITARKGAVGLRELFASKSILEKQGNVILVGFGPGNPDLLTVKAVRAIEGADVIFYDDLISKDYLDDKRAEKVYVGKRSGCHSAEQTDINRMMLNAARAGKNVVRLKGGDPMLFAHASEEIEYLQSNLIDVSVIPGVTTASAMAASLKVSLTHRELSSSVALVNGHTETPITPDAETLVYYMGASRLRNISEALVRQGWAKNTPVALIYNVSGKDETVFDTTLGQLSSKDESSVKKAYTTPLIALVGNVAGLRHSAAASAKLILFTGIRPEEGDENPDYTYTPLIKISELLDKSEIRKTVEEIGEYDYLLFTSRFGVEYWFNEALPDTIKRINEGHTRVVSIGPTTAKALHEAGVTDVIVSNQYDSYGIIDTFARIKELVNNNEKLPSVLIPRSDLAKQIIPEGLKQLGFRVKTVTAYANTLPDNPRKVVLRHFKKVIFTSPSTIDNFIKIYGGLPAYLEYETIGAVTQAHLEEKLKDRRLK